ncbi:D-alanine--D-alanine ligase [Aeromicrobium sp. NPDC092404]|uniref:D-alanine--D-alanine ligase family protein n=1 Tax=Aeromicrobium sp. NPDC092404 TaxID=3154976 RepID=UPI003444C7EA
MSRVRVAVIGGGQSSEHAVSLASAASVAAALDPSEHDVVTLTIGRDGTWQDATGPLGTSSARSLAAAVEQIATCDVALPVVHGPKGEDGTLAALCDLAGVPYVGSGVRGGALAMDKWATKLVAQELGIRTAHGDLVTATDARRLSFEDPVVVKPVAAGSSHGVTLVRTAADLDAAIETALALDDRALVEELVTGREVDIAVLERPDGSRLVGPALEIVVPRDALFDADTKYDGSADFRLPAQLEEPDLKALSDAALALFDALGCAGVARFDFFLTPDGPVLNEVNTMPGMTAESQVPRMFAAIGLPYADLLAELVAAALGTARAR